MTYSQALQSPEWLSFRHDFIESRKQNGDAVCDDCGEDSLGGGMLHVHHRVYFRGRLPWEYDFEQLRLLCKNCHELIHSTEMLAVNLIRTFPPHVSYEFETFLLELAELPDGQSVKIALARAKSAVREIPIPICDPALPRHTLD